MGYVARLYRYIQVFQRKNIKCNVRKLDKICSAKACTVCIYQYDILGGIHILIQFLCLAQYSLELDIPQRLVFEPLCKGETPSLYVAVYSNQLRNPVLFSCVYTTQQSVRVNQGSSYVFCVQPLIQWIQRISPCEETDTHKEAKRRETQFCEKRLETRKT